MLTSFAIAAFIILSAITLLAIAAMARAMLDSIRKRRQVTYVPVPDPNPPAPVARSNGAVLLTAGAGLWVVAHLCALAYWGATGEFVERSARAVILALYVAAAAIIVAIGVLLFGARKPFGRRVIAWGEFLFGIMSFMGGLIALLLPGQEDVPIHIKQNADVLLIFFIGHLTIDTLIGSLSQKVARPAAQPQTVSPPA